MKVVLPLVLAAVGIGAGSAAGIFFPIVEPDSCSSDNCEDAKSNSVDGTEDEQELSEVDASESEYVRLQNQFVIPVVRDELVRSLVVMSISLEISSGTIDLVYAQEPKLRDALLRVLFDHAHVGGFDGTFTESSRLSMLRVALLEAAKGTLGQSVTDILITDIVRQEV